MNWPNHLFIVHTTLQSCTTLQCLTAEGHEIQAKTAAADEPLAPSLNGGCYLPVDLRILERVSGFDFRLFRSLGRSRTRGLQNDYVKLRNHGCIHICTCGCGSRPCFAARCTFLCGGLALTPGLHIPYTNIPTTITLKPLRRCGLEKPLHRVGRRIFASPAFGGVGIRVDSEDTVIKIWT